MGRGRGCLGWLLRFALLGLIVIPAVAVLAFSALVLTSEATGAPAAPDFQQWLWTALLRSGFEPPITPFAEPPPASPSPSASPFAPTIASPSRSYVNDGTSPLSFTLTPSPSPPSTATVSPTPTATETPTGTATATPSSTVTATWTSSPTNTPWPTWTPTDPPTNTPQATATDTAVPASSTPAGTASATATIDPAAPTPTHTPTDPPTAEPTATADTGCTTSLNLAYENEVISLINEARADNGLQALSLRSQLRSAARVHAEDMACNHFTSHTGSDGSSVADRVEAQGYSWSWIGENYMVTRGGPQTAFDWWMNSDPHRNNILGSAYTEIGVGYINGPDSDYGGYYVVVFARPG